MKIRSYREKEFPEAELIIRAFSTKWGDEDTEVLFRITWKDLFGNYDTSADVSLNKRQVKSMIKFLKDWLEHG